MKFFRLALLCVFVLQTGTAQNGKTDKVKEVVKAKIEEAALLAVEQSIGSLRQQERTSDQLAVLIMSAPSSHLRREDSERLLRAGERAFLQEAVREQLAAFASTRSDLPPGWVSQVMARQRERIDKTVEGILQSTFSERFNHARDIAVKEQREKLSETVTPSSNEVEELAGPYRTFADLPLDEAQRRALESGSALISKRVKSAYSGKLVFEENEAYLKDQASQVFSREITELWQQLHYIVQHTGGGEIEASRIEVAIAKGLSSLPSRHAPFPITRAAIHDRALELERKLYLDYLKAQLDSCTALPAQAVLNRVPSQADALPRTLDEHVKDVLPILRDHTATLMLNNWTARLSPSSRTNLQSKLKRLSNEPPGNQILDDGITHCVRDALRPFREMLAAKELSARWPDGASLALQFDDAAVTKLNNEAAVNEDELLPSPKFHLEEAEKAFTENRHVLIDEATKSVRVQMSLVRDPGRVEKYQRELNSNPTDFANLNWPHLII